MDRILVTHLGELGLYQKVHYVLIAIPCIFLSIHAFSWGLTGAPIKHRCLYPGENDTAEYQPVNTWHQSISNSSSTTNGCHRISGLSIYDPFPEVNSTLIFEPCKDGYAWDHSEIAYSATERWSLVCDRNYIGSTIQGLYFVGQILGSLFFGILSDKIGRKPVLVITVFIQLVCGACAAVVPVWGLMALLRILTGFAYPGIQIVTVVMGAELVGPKYRIWGSIGTGLFWAIGQVILGALSYPLGDYRYLQLAISLPAILLLSYWWILPESARWLLSQGKYDEVNRILTRVAKWNGKGPLPKWYANVSGDQPRPQSNTAWWKSIGSLFRSPRLRIRTIITITLYVFGFMVYYGLGMNPAFKGGRIRTAFLLSGLLEVPGLLVALPVNILGRKCIVAGGFIVVGACLILTLAVPSGYPVVSMLLVVTGKAALTSVRVITYMWTSEHYPTSIRSTATGVGTMIGPLGGVAASYFALSLAQGHPELVAVAFGLASILAGVLALFLPETTGEPLTETIEEAEKLGIGQPIFVLGFNNQKVAVERIRKKDIPIENVKQIH